MPANIRDPRRAFFDAQAASTEARREIPGVKLVRDLVQVANGSKIVTRHQLSAMFKLLDKVVPDLSHVTLAEVREKPLRELSDAELNQILAQPPTLLLAPAVKNGRARQPSA